MEFKLTFRSHLNSKTPPKRQDYISCAIFATILLVTIIFMPAVSAQENATKELTFGPGTLDELKKNPDFIAAHGNIPTFANSEERKQWLDKLNKIYTKANKDYEKGMSKYFGPDSPVIAYTYTIDGVLEVRIKKGQKIDTAKENEIYNLFSKYGQEINVANTPLVFVYGDFPVPVSRTSSWISYGLIGGIRVYTNDPSGAYSTLSFAAKTNSGTKGYVISGYAAPTVGDQVWQPSSGNSYKVGTVSKVPRVYADAAWVPYTGTVQAKIYEYDTDHLRTVTSYGDPAVGDLVYKSGITTGETAGYVTAVGTIRYDSSGRPFYNQCIAGCQVNYGDSGSPVFHQVYGTNNALIYGIISAGDGAYTPGYGFSSAVISPESGIYTDLGVHPLI